MRIKRDGTGRQIIVNHEHSGETILGTWVSGIIFNSEFQLKFLFFLLIILYF